MTPMIINMHLSNAASESRASQWTEYDRSCPFSREPSGHSTLNHSLSTRILRLAFFRVHSAETPIMSRPVPPLAHFPTFSPAPAPVRIVSKIAPSTAIPSPSGIQLLGCVHRKICIKNEQTSRARKPRNALSNANKTVGDQLRFARRAKGITQRNLAKKLHLNVNTVIGWEKDRLLPSANHLQAIRAVVGATS